MKIHGTAKGGALSTKDFGVAFGGAAACVEATYNDLPDESLEGRVVGVGRLGIALQINAGHVLEDKLVKSVKFKLDNDSRSPDETIFVRARNAAGDVIEEFGEMNATNLTSSVVEYQTDQPPFTNINQITLSAGDMITLEYPITSGDAIQTMIFGGAVDYVDNATTLVSTTDLGTWSAFEYPSGNYLWIWLECVYCE